MKTHAFHSTGDAYDACQCDESIKNGDILLIASEEVVGLADTWPTAVTVKHGNLHQVAAGYHLEDHFPLRSVLRARAIAVSLGWRVS